MESAFGVEHGEISKGVPKGLAKAGSWWRMRVPRAGRRWLQGRRDRLRPLSG